MCFVPLRLPALSVLKISLRTHINAKEGLLKSAELRVQSQVYQDDQEIKSLLGEKTNTDETLEQLTAAFNDALRAVVQKREELAREWTQKEAAESLDAQGASDLIAAVTAAVKDFSQSTEFKAAKSAAQDISKFKSEVKKAISKQMKEQAKANANKSDPGSPGCWGTRQSFGTVSRCWLGVSWRCVGSLVGGFL